MSSQTTTKSGTKPALGWKANIAIMLIVSVLGLWAADRVFRVYERNFLVPDLPDPQSSSDVNLTALRYNDDRVSRRTAEDEFRILSFGDSFAYSVVEPKFSYNGIVEHRLNEAMPEYQVRVVNLGEPATGTRQYREAWSYWSEILQHQGALFMIFLGNDLLDDAYLHASVTWSPNEAVIQGDHPVFAQANRRVPQKFPLRMMDYAYAWLKSATTSSDQGLPEGYNWAGITDFDEETFLRINARYLENFDPEKLSDLLPGYEQIRLLLIQAQELADAGMPVAVALGPSESQVDDRLRAKVLASERRSEAEFDLTLPQRIIFALQVQVAPDVTVFDLTAAFRAQRLENGEKLFFRKNTHWDMAGNALAGRLISDKLREAWLGQSANQATGTPDLSVTSNQLVSDAAIARYLDQLAGVTGSGGTRITGAVRAIQMLDGITGDNDNWAIAPLQQPVLLEFEQALTMTGIEVHLFDAEQRAYRYRLEVRDDEGWTTIAESPDPVQGRQVFAWTGGPATAVRITGLWSSAAGADNNNAYIHISELVIIQP